MSRPLAQLLDTYHQRVDAYLQQQLDIHCGPAEQLDAAIRYSLFNGGKRLRPALVYATGEALGAALPQLDAAAAAIELIHTYSLVHDDLPAMDDDDLRRGRPTCHKAYDEATAILAGDALQTLAFTLLAASNHPATLNQLHTLAVASGTQGMIGGQMLDLLGETRSLSLEELQTLHQHKTGALIRAAVRMGALAADADTATLQALDDYAQALGLAFQIQDDLLDVLGDASKLGKQTGADERLHKTTYPGLLGIDQASHKASELIGRAHQSLNQLDGDWHCLHLLADWAIRRDH